MLPKCFRATFVSSLLLAVVLVASGRTAHPGQARLHHLGLLAYVQGNSLWVTAVPAGQATRLISVSDGHIRRPRWSPSGLWLAYHKDNELWVVRRSGADARVLNSGAVVSRFAWSPVSDILTYTARSGSLVVVSPEEWRERELVTNPAGQGGTGGSDATWSPDGEWLAYVRNVWENGRRSVGLWRIRSHGTDATHLFTPTTPLDEGVIVAKWSLDGQHILFWAHPHFSESLLADGTSLHAISTEGGAPRQLIESMLVYDDFLASSPDGKRLAVTAEGIRETWSHKRIAVVELSSGKLMYLTDDKTAAFSPAWSPDGKRIAYVAAPDIGFLGGGEEARVAAGRRRIWVMNGDGSNQRQLTRDAAYRDERPLWSADGRHLLFARLHQGGRASLWLMRADGSRLTRVVEELSPAPHWFGYYGAIYWDWSFDWWTDSPR